MRRLGRALSLALLLLSVGWAGVARAGRDYDPRQIDRIGGMPRSADTAWLLSWPLASEEHPEGDEVGRAMSDLLGFAAFRHFRGGFGGGDGVLWRATADASHRSFDDASAALARAGVDLVIHGRYQQIGDDFLLLPQLTVLPDPNGQRSQELRWTTRLEVDGQSYAFSAGLSPRTFELPQVIVPGDVVRAHVNSRGWLVCRTPAGASKCRRAAGVLDAGFLVESFDELDGGVSVKVRTASGARGYVYVPLGPRTLDPLSYFVAGLAALHRAQYKLAIEAFDKVAASTGRGGATSEMIAHSEVYGCLAGTRLRAQGGAFSGCGERVERARKENPFDSVVAEYSVLDLVQRVKQADRQEDPLKREAVLRLFDEGVRSLSHRLPVEQREVVKGFSTAAGIPQLRLEGARFQLEGPGREGGVRPELRLEGGLPQLRTANAPPQVLDYGAMMDRVLAAPGLVKEVEEEQ